MKRISIITLLFVAVASLSSCGYNTMVSMDETVQGQWSNVENAYQRRADLIPNLVKTVKGYADFEQETLEKVVLARASATQVKVDPSNITPESLQQFQQAQSQVGSALSRLLLVVERYPDLKANQGFLELQAQLEGTENRIAVERRNFNDTVKEYNSYIRAFPRIIYAGWFGFSKKAYFEAEEGSEKVPEVQF
jgi:LemA protein